MQIGQHFSNTIHSRDLSRYGFFIVANDGVIFNEFQGMEDDRLIAD